MKRRSSLPRAVFAAAGLALLASIMVPFATAWWNIDTALRLVAPILGMTYLLYFFHSISAQTGRVIAICAWSAFTLACWWLSPSLSLYLLLHAGALWFIRSLFAYSGLLPALGDALLTAFSVMAFTWAFTRSGSVFLATWSFFLVQAMWVFIPERLLRQADKRPSPRNKDPFERAQRQADAALRQLFRS